jgi:hypothetical protein
MVKLILDPGAVQLSDKLGISKERDNEMKEQVGKWISNAPAIGHLSCFQIAQTICNNEREVAFVIYILSSYMVKAGAFDAIAEAVEEQTGHKL